MFEALKSELEAIASQELGDVLGSWDSLSDEQATRLARYLRSELSPWGMLSNEKAKDFGSSLSKERAQARRLLKSLDSRKS